MHLPDADQVISLHDLRLVLQCKRGVCSCGMLCSVDWWLVTGVSGQFIGSFSNGQEV